ncbi:MULTISPECIES: tRNA pseudouridine(38-40) synthase TruA [unclassified Methanoculleus]|mgnify:FL=1|uniref:tRNA pseudouridine(38-40) synthase TruA n=1 Tax=unclassified Methanoculleus TaxID=2619537 RepID=UPI0025EFE444|nr:MULTISPECIES: tRNA pseudouridine(38-40) synthase TruA [unclassified Methanoculleus]MCK9316772.1 tRNA pseudouridine(38-40) synthase TruA [Methanoculleus sp.]MDD2252767.1 tRNA pseudouridine(38-40) synthase TruA [Methanoculleus sp.]MDD2786490.1 tRNA pseudouridine(38-40) synthase TruA [Methanoculleus sp.]MDD3215250.1 tRNA pseudouridine(38-40) synthase TruA [Methanoculleus sp.]MDD4313010.1 tRNA pseudouridine(38-40) synthase TruA [Methanoculleus sp.]
MNLAFRFSYFGDRFFGSQVQPGLRTVEGEFIEACRRLELFDGWREAKFVTAGRTDRGVHAKNQVCSFQTDKPERAVAALNQVLPADIWCTGWAGVPDGFHPRYSAASRTYRYYFFPAPGDTAAMHDAAQEFVGLHDFSAFARASDRNPERRIIRARVFDDRPFVVFEVTGESFLWNMVRCMASALERVGRDEAGPGEIARLLVEPAGRRGPAAPPEGLVLWDIGYAISFTPLPIGEKSRRYLADRHRHHTLMAEVSARLTPEGPAPDTS